MCLFLPILWGNWLNSTDKKLEIHLMAHECIAWDFASKQDSVPYKCLCWRWTKGQSGTTGISEGFIWRLWMLLICIKEIMFYLDKWINPTKCHIWLFQHKHTIQNLYLLRRKIPPILLVVIVLLQHFHSFPLVLYTIKNDFEESSKDIIYIL